MKDILKGTFVLVLIALIAGFMLGFVNNLTKEPISERTEIAKETSLNNVIDERYSIDMDNQISDEVKLDLEGVIIDEAYEFVDDDGNFTGVVALVTSHEGYKDVIQISVGIEMVSNRLKTGEICGMDFLSINETPGLGMNVKDEDFIDQYIGKSKELIVSKNADEENEIDTVSGATISSEAVTDAVNAALAFYNSYVGAEVE